MASYPVAIAVTPNGATAYFVCEELIGAPGGVVPVDTATGTAGKTIDRGGSSHPHPARTVAVTDRGHGQITTAGAAILVRVPTLPRSYGSLFVRTEFYSDALWRQVVDAAQRESEDGFMAGFEPVSDPEFDQASWDTVKAACPDDPSAAVLFIADTTTLTSPDHPILVVDLLESRAPFRCVPAALWSVENNLNIANLDWEDFADEADEADEAGIFRGFRA